GAAERPRGPHLVPAPEPGEGAGRLRAPPGPRADRRRRGRDEAAHRGDAPEGAGDGGGVRAGAGDADAALPRRAEVGDPPPRRLHPRLRRLRPRLRAEPAQPRPAGPDVDALGACRGAPRPIPDSLATPCAASTITSVSSSTRPSATSSRASVGSHAEASPPVWAMGAIR